MSFCLESVQLQVKLEITTPGPGDARTITQWLTLGGENTWGHTVSLVVSCRLHKALIRPHPLLSRDNEPSEAIEPT